MAYGFDEMYCAQSQWICPSKWIKYNRYDTPLWDGQWAPESIFCDGEWDLPDASDEFNCKETSRTFQIFIENYFNWPCKNVETGKKLDMTQYRHRHLLGDGKIDCIGGQDERYTESCHDSLQIRDRFRCSDGTCIYQEFTCDGIKHCPDGEDELSPYCAIFNRSYCKKGNFQCGTSLCLERKVRCNRIVECKYDRMDEISCHGPLISHKKIEKKIPITKKKRNTERKAWVRYPELVCPNGFYLYNSFDEYVYKQCFCPPSLYGDYCQYQAHRVTITFTLDIKLDIINTRSTALRILIVLQYHDQTIDYIVLSYGTSQLPLKTKQRFYLLYPLPLLETIRQSSSTDYTVTFYGYIVTKNQVDLAYIWRYPIKFPFFPAYRLVVQLSPMRPLQCSQTIINKCGPMSKRCHMIDDITYYCECQSSWYGPHCSEQRAQNPCATFSQYLPAFRYGLNQSHDFICMCAINQNGRTCHITLNYEPPCLLFHTIFDNYLQNHPRYECIYYDTHRFIGSYLFSNWTITTIEDKIVIDFSIDFISNISSMILLQINQLNEISRQLTTVSQEVLKTSEKQHKIMLQMNVTHRVFIKIYKFNQNNSARKHDMFLFWSQRFLGKIVHFTMADRCFSIQELTHLIPSYNPNEESLKNLMRTIKFYHRPCQYLNISCFYDESTYFCWCRQNERSASCELYDSSSDKCDYCLNDGVCLFGNEMRASNNFICHCPNCIYGSLCQYRTAQFGYSLEALLASTDDQYSNNTNSENYFAKTYKLPIWKIICLITAIIMMSFGFLSNICSYISIYYLRTIRSSVTYIVMSTCVINQLCLISLSVQIIYILLNEVEMLSNNNVNLILCKTIPYVVKTFTFISKWSVAYVSLIRLHKLSIMQDQSKQNYLSLADKLQLLFYIIFIFLVFGSTISEILFHNLVDINKENYVKLQCAIELSDKWNKIDTILLFIHHLLPFIFNIYSLIMIIVSTAKIRLTVEQRRHFFSTFWSQIIKIKKQLICPLFLILSSLPQLIIGFVIDCEQWYNMWLRYFILALYLISHIPEVLSFLLLIYPSTIYMNSFRQTRIGKCLMRRQ